MSGPGKVHGFVAHSAEDGFFKMTLEDFHSLNRELRMMHESNRYLLAALIAIEATLERYRPSGAPLPDSQRQARAAIAKAVQS